jgi:[ribosomal protein S5]-alanine N-acetyltransferase
VKIALPRLGDGHTTLRPLTIDDVPAYAEAFQDDPELGKLLGIDSDPDEASLRERINAQKLETEERTFLQLAIADPKTDAFWGEVIVHSLNDRHRRGEIGFWVVPSQRRCGVAFDAISVTLDWLFSELDLLRVEMTTTPANEVVPAIARRLNFTYEGLLRARNLERGQRVDVLWFGLLREEWARR